MIIDRLARLCLWVMEVDRVHQQLTDMEMRLEQLEFIVAGQNASLGDRDNVVEFYSGCRANPLSKTKPH